MICARRCMWLIVPAIGPSIASAGGALTPFNACGDLIDAGGCLLLEDDSGATYALEETGSFSAGDRVFVAGTLDGNAAPCAGFTGAAIVDNSIDSCFETYGLLEEGADGCLLLRSDDMGLIAIENTDSYEAGDFIFAAGLFVTNSTLCPGETSDAIEQNMIKRAIIDCGTLTAGPPGCLIFELDNDDSFFIENTGGFGVGDTIFVRGIINPSSEICDPFISVAIEQNIVGECIDECGRIVMTESGCPLFITEEIGAFYIENLSGYPIGPRMSLLGGLSSDGPPCADPAAPLVIGNTIRDDCQGDLNGDGAVNTRDLSALLGSWGPCGKQCPADLSGDGMVAARDLSILLANWTGDVPPPP